MVHDEQDGRDPRGRRSSGATDPLAADGLTSRLSELAREFAAAHGRAETLDAVVDAAVDAIPGAEHASISVTARRHQGTTLAWTSAVAREVDQSQYDTSEGPCLDALYAHVTVRADDLRREPRWPTLAQLAVGRGIRSMLALQLFVEGDDLGALNLFSADAGAFTDESEQVGLAFAAHAAVAVASAQEIETLRRAVDSRDLIGQAKGVLMERHGITADVAFSVLVRYSRDSNVKLVDVAEHVVSTSVDRSTQVTGP